MTHYSRSLRGSRILDGTNAFSTLRLVSNHGHLRRIEVARALWPTSTPDAAIRMAHRVVAPLVAAEYLCEMANAFGERSLVLTPRGAACVRQRGGFEARSGLGLSLNGQQFRHRSIATMYLIERSSAQENQVYGDHALRMGCGPTRRSELAKRFGVVPDGLVLMPGLADGNSSKPLLADWVKVVWTPMNTQEIERIFSIAWQVGTWLDPGNSVRFNRVIVVCDARRRGILNTLRQYLLANPTPEGTPLNITLARCRIDVPLIWRGHEELDSAQILGAHRSVSPGTSP